MLKIHKGNENLNLNGFNKKIKNTKLVFDNHDLEVHFYNNENGIRQDFKVLKKPQGKNNLMVELKVNSPFELKANASMLAHMIEGKIAVSYENLFVTDAEGRILKSKFSLNKNILSINVDDHNAKYPILIDPLSTTPTWSAEQNQADAAFGYTMA